MPDTKASLLQLVAALTAHGAHGEAARERFNRLPDRVMDEHGLPPDARLALLSMDMGKIGDFLKSELLVWKFPDREFPEIDTDCALPHGAAPLAGLYPMPTPELRAVNPEKGVAKADETITVYGEGFVPPVALRLVGPGGTFDFDGSNARVTLLGSFRCSRLEVALKLPEAKGSYSVRVVHRAGPNEELVLSQNPLTFEVI